jgi:MFS family permease
MLIAVFVPIFVAFSRDWFDRPDARNAVKLFLVTTACAGLSDSSLFLVPALAAFLASGALLARGASPATARLLVGYFASLAWLYAIGAYILAVVDRSQMAHLGFEQRFPGSFLGQLGLVFGDPPGPFLWVYLLALVAAWLNAREGEQRAFLTGWMLAALALLNPLLFPWVTAYLTSYNGFWRLFFLPPFLLAVGIASAGLADRLAVRRPARHALAILLLLAAAALGNLVEPFASNAVFSRRPLAVGGYKIGPRMQEDVRAILARAVPGAMLAPLHYSAVIPLYSAELPQIAVRGYMLRHTAIANGEPELAESRMRAIGFVTRADRPQAANDLVELLAREELKNVVASRRAASSPLLKRLLREQGFRPVVQRSRFSLFVRNPGPTRSDGVEPEGPPSS